MLPMLQVEVPRAHRSFFEMVSSSHAYSSTSHRVDSAQNARTQFPHTILVGVTTRLLAWSGMDCLLLRLYSYLTAPEQARGVFLLNSLCPKQCLDLPQWTCIRSSVCDFFVCGVTTSRARHDLFSLHYASTPPRCSWTTGRSRHLGLRKVGICTSLCPSILHIRSLRSEHHYTRSRRLQPHRS